MKTTNYNTMVANGRVHPRGHTCKTRGPWDLRIGTTSQPLVYRWWEAKATLLAIDQPNKEDNFTLLYVLFLQTGTGKPSLVRGLKFRKARCNRRPDKTIEVHIKGRYGNSFPHPIPIGRYTGTCMYDMLFVLFTLQARTLRKEPGPVEPKVIITPGDAKYGESLRDIKRAFPRDDGLGR